MNEDLVFRVYLPFAPLLATGNDTAARAVMLKTAASKAATFSAKVGAYQASAWRKSSSVNPPANYGVLMDQTMDLELMFWAARETGNQTYYDQAISHAKMAAANHVRADGGSFQWIYYDAATGQKVLGETAQGYANDSTWARGQAWGIHAFTMIYRETGDAQFYATAKKLADYYLDRLPADLVLRHS